ncbi:hypothetical protein PIB30_073483 [Stylosanthes scabra]|uniref:Uncharacterized protein n=1 Tax=Stylosanthes scabra TaxID=79078 RepID=A0ABU6YNA8_9FABA|nr:hypothetical protein [Stylosanthes scabra]
MDGANNVRYWCFFNGWVPGVYTTEEDMRFQTDGFEGPSWTTADSIEAAEDAWIVYLGHGSRDVGCYRLQMGEAPPIFIHAPGRQCVPPRAQPHPLVTVSMRGLLQDACRKLDMPAPIYPGMMCTSLDGRRRFHDLVSFVLPGSSHALVLEDAARAGLRVVLRSNNASIDDYNYRIVQRWKEKYAQLCKELATPEATVPLLTTSNDAPWSQLRATDIAGHSRLNGPCHTGN